MELPIIGTIEFIANLTDLNPRASALDATAVFSDKYDTKIAERADIDFVIKFLRADTMLPIFKSRRIEEQTDMPIKQFTTGKNIFADMKLSA